MTQAEVERRILELERKLAGGGTCGQPGLSTLFGQTSVALRDRFPVVLTSTFDATTGYSWERLFLTTGDGTSTVTTATDPQSGSFAFTPDNNEDLSVGDRGWLEADPNAGGWVFLPVAGSASLPVTSREMATGIFTLAVQDTWETITDSSGNVAVSLGPGTWLIATTVLGRVISLTALGDVSTLYVRLQNLTDNTQVRGSFAVVSDGTSNAGTLVIIGTACSVTIYTIESGTKEIALQGMYDDPGTTDGEVFGTFPGDEQGTHIRAIKIG